MAGEAKDRPAADSDGPSREGQPKKAASPDPAAGGQAPRRRVWRVVPVLVLLAGLSAFLFLAPDQHRLLDALQDHRAMLTGWALSHPLAAAMAFILFYTLVTAFSLPIASLVTVFGGFLFGAVWGTVWAVLGATFGACLVFLAVRLAFLDLARARFGRKMARLEQGFARDALGYMLFLRLVPLFPFFLVNIAPAFFGVRLRTFALATLLGIIPGTFVFANVGRSLGLALDRAEGLSLETILTLDLFLALSLLGLLALVPSAYRRLRSRRGARGEER